VGVPTPLAAGKDAGGEEGGARGRRGEGDEREEALREKEASVGLSDRGTFALSVHIVVRDAYIC
jgi:hypothetical protein